MPRLGWESSRLIETQYFSTFHWHTTLDGYSGFVPSRHGDYARELEALPAERPFAMLRSLGFRYVVVHDAELVAGRVGAHLPGGRPGPPGSAR